MVAHDHGRRVTVTPDDIALANDHDRSAKETAYLKRIRAMTDRLERTPTPDVDDRGAVYDALSRLGAIVHARRTEALERMLSRLDERIGNRKGEK